MPLINKEDKGLSEIGSGLPEGSRTFRKNPQTPSDTPSNNGIEFPRQEGQTPYVKGRFANYIDGRPGEGPPMPSKGNPNSRGSVFEPWGDPRRQKTQKQSSLRESGPSGLSERSFLNKPIDLTKDDAEVVPHNSTIIDDSNDSLNPGAAERSKTRIADDGSATRSLKADRCRSWLSGWGPQTARDMVLRELDLPVTSQSKEQQSSPPTIPNTDRERGSRSSVFSHVEVPSFTSLLPSSGGEVPLPLKATQMVKQMNTEQTTEEQRDTREVAKNEAIAGSSNQPQRRSLRLSTIRSSFSAVNPSNQPQRRSLRQLTLCSSFSAVNPTCKSPDELLLVDSSNQPQRRSSQWSTLRSSSSAVNPTRKSPNELLLVYTTPVPGTINITRGDLERLQLNGYLNDTLIEFGLKLWLNDLRDRDPELADQIYLFNSFFYTKLAIKDERAGYESVRGWTSRVDVFSKKYLVVPINEDLHWYLAIIYKPEYTLRPARPPDLHVMRKRKRDEELSADSATGASELRGVPTTPSKPTLKAATEIPEEGEVETVTDSEPPRPKMEVEGQTQTDGTTKPEEQEVQDQLCAGVSSVSLDKCEQDASGFLNDLMYSPEADATDVQSFNGAGAAPSRTYGRKKPGILAPEKSGGGSRRGDLGRDIEIAPLEKDNTYIFMFDSLNKKHPGAMKNLAQYLQFEAADKKGVENPSSPVSVAAHVPTQGNFYDCGLYLLHFVRVFMEDPAKSVHTILTKQQASKVDREADWKKNLVGTLRRDLARRILELSKVWVKAQQEVRSIGTNPM